LINAALALIPSHEGTVFRGASCNIWKWYDFAPGSVFCDPAFLSTSKDKGTAENFAMTANNDENLEGPGVILEILCHQGGKYVAPYACFDHYHEEEVLFPPSTMFKIKEVQRDDENGSGYILMEEEVNDFSDDGGDDEDPAESVADVQTPIQSSTEDDSRVSQPTGGTVNLDGMGSQWVDGQRRSARHQPQLGSVFVNGLRRSARRLLV
jgi:hypothetical protein